MDWERKFYKITGVVVCVYILFFILGDYNKNWVHPEVAYYHIDGVLSGGTGLKFSDFSYAFNRRASYDADRTRLLSYLFQALNIKTRNLLFNYITPHPSFSITWPLTFILSPILLFKFIFNLTSNRNTAYTCVLLFVTSSGFLAGGTLFFHLGKPLAVFFIILGFYVASKLNLSIGTERNFSKASKKIYLLLLLTLFFSYFADETAWILFACIPVIFPRIFIFKEEKTPRKSVILLYLSTFGLFLLFITYAVPQIVLFLGFEPFDFWHHLFNNTSANAKLTLSDFLKVLYGYLSCYIGIYNEANKFFTLNLVIYAVISGYLFFLFIKMTSEERVNFSLALSTIFLCVLFETLLHTKHIPGYGVSYYYGAVFPVFLTIPLAIGLNVNKDLLSNIINKIILVVFLVLFISNFNKINYDWKNYHTRIYRSYFKLASRGMVADKKLTFSMVNKAWKMRDNKRELRKLKRQYPINSLWLFRELDFL